MFYKKNVVFVLSKFVFYLRRYGKMVVIHNNVPERFFRMFNGNVFFCFKRNKSQSLEYSSASTHPDSWFRRILFRLGPKILTHCVRSISFRSALWHFCHLIYVLKTWFITQSDYRDRIKPTNNYCRLHYTTSLCVFV